MQVSARAMQTCITACQQRPGLGMKYLGPGVTSARDWKTCFLSPHALLPLPTWWKIVRLPMVDGEVFGFLFKAKNIPFLRLQPTPLWDTTAAGKMSRSRNPLLPRPTSPYPVNSRWGSGSSERHRELWPVFPTAVPQAGCQDRGDICAFVYTPASPATQMPALREVQTIFIGRNGAINMPG